MSREDFLKRRALAKQRATLAAARARFAADGLEGASVERIAQDAGVSTATLYKYFPSKFALFEAVLRDGVIDFEATLAQCRDLAPRERLKRLAYAYAALLDDPLNAGILRAVFSAAPASPEIARMFYEHVKSVVGGAFHDAVDAARKAKAIKRSKDIHRPGGQLMGMIEHATLWRRLLTNQPGEEAPSAIAEAALATFWAAHGSEKT